MKNYNLLRWIAVLPCAVAVYFIIYTLTKAMGMISLYFHYDPDDYYWVTKVTLPAFASAIGTYYYIKAGVYVAPDHKYYTLIFLIIPMALFLFYSLYLQWAFRFHWQYLIEEVVGLGALVYAYFEVRKEELIR